MAGSQWGEEYNVHGAHKQAIIIIRRKNTGKELRHLPEQNRWVFRLFNRDAVFSPEKELGAPISVNRHLRDQQAPCLFIPNFDGPRLATLDLVMPGLATLTIVALSQAQKLLKDIKGNSLKWTQKKLKKGKYYKYILYRNTFRTSNCISRYLSYSFSSGFTIQLPAFGCYPKALCYLLINGNRG